MPVLKYYYCCIQLRIGAIIACCLTAVWMIWKLIITLILVQFMMNYYTTPKKTKEIYPLAVLFMYYLSELGLVSTGLICLGVALGRSVKEFVLPWLICILLLIILDTILATLLVINGIIFGVIMLIFLAFMVYLWFVVLSFYQEQH